MNIRSVAPILQTRCRVVPGSEPEKTRGRKEEPKGSFEKIVPIEPAAILCMAIYIIWEWLSRRGKGSDERFGYAN
jgi:hypothetical protein